MPSKKLNAGAFSDDKVVEASKKLLSIMVDCDWGKKNSEMSKKYNIKGFPTVIFTDPDGNEIERLGARDPASVVSQIERVARRHPGK